MRIRIVGLPVALCVASLTISIAAQAPARQAFDAASVKPAPEGMMAGFRVAPGRLTGNFTVKELILLAFRTPDLALRPNQIVNGPDWLETEHFAVNAEVTLTGEITPTFPPNFGRPYGVLVRSLLEDRFKLAVHIDKRDFPVYALVVARSDGRLGPNLHASPLTDAECEARRQRSALEAPHCGGVVNRPQGFTATRVPMSQMIAFLGQTDRIVVDRTGLHGFFDAELQRSEDVSIFTAVAEQFGLKLEPRREPFDALVVDHVEHPTPD